MSRWTSSVAGALAGLLLAGGTALLPSRPAAAATGTGALDGTFGPGTVRPGLVVTPVGAERVEGVRPVPLPDGRVLLVAVRRNSTGGSAGTLVTRYTADGAVDTTFAASGSTPGTALVPAIAYPGPVAVQPDGGIVLAGGGLLSRLRADGTLDEDFGKLGCAPSPCVPPPSTPGTRSMDFNALDVVALSDGKLLVALGANLPTGRVGLARLQANGTDDTTFVPGSPTPGRTVLDLPQAYGHVFLHVASDGRATVTTGVRTSLAMARFTANGQVDTSFSPSGIKTIDIGATDLGLFASTVDGDGRFLLAGSRSRGSLVDNYVARVLPSGVLDPAWNPAGSRPGLATIGGGQLGGIAVTSANRVAVAIKGTFSMGVARLTGSGHLDGSFHPEGSSPGWITVPTPIDPGPPLYSVRPPIYPDAISGVAAQPDGKFLVAGTSGQTVVGGQPGYSLHQLILRTKAYVAPAAPLVSPLSLPEAPTRFVPLAPRRILDTRNGLGAGSRIANAESRMFFTGITSNGSVPRAVALNITAVSPEAAGFIAVYPCGQPPNTSNVNFGPGQTVAAHVVVPVNANGEACMVGSANTNVIADLFGYFTSGGMSFTPSSPVRLLDTRNGIGAPTQKVAGGGVVRVVVPGPGGSRPAAAVVNVTAVGPEAAGFVTVFPCGERPTVSNLNYAPGQVVANLVTTPTDASGGVCVSTDATSHLLVDVVGTYGGSGTSDLVPASPTRILDTRNGIGGPKATVPADGHVVLHVGGLPGVSPQAPAVVLNVTAVGARAAGFVTAYACGDVPVVSNLNYPPGAAVPNLVAAPVSPAGDVCLFTSAPTELIADLFGSYEPLT